MSDSKFFSTSTRTDVIKNMLESHKTKDKLMAMKKIIALMSQGINLEELFPFVVKNIIVDHLELKKLSYLYLIHYAERQPDNALLSVNHFQKDLKDKNQFFRALSLRVLSSIRVPLISQIIVMAIKKCSTDMSPYVRKAAAIAIPKAYSLDNNLKEQLIEIVNQLLNDNNTMVLGSTMYAFNEICPTEYQLLHKHFRKICKYLVDCDEWGQVIIINVLLRYARTQFLSPFNNTGKKKSFYSSDESEDDESDDSDDEKHDPLRKKKDNVENYELDPDHSLLLNSTFPLLRTRNKAVVLAVISLYFHCAPQTESHKIVKPALRILKGNFQEQSIILTIINSMSKVKPELFFPYIKNFYVYSSDTLFIKRIKLDIISNLSTEGNIHSTLKEFRSYIKFPENQFVVKLIEIIGIIASKINEISEICVAGLMNLINHRSEKVVAQAVSTIRTLIAKKPKEHKNVIKRLVKLIEVVKVPIARASILWMIGEYSSIIPRVGPDAIRIVAKNFSNEHDIVKLQVITMATKLFLKKQKKLDPLLFKYLLTLGKYDKNYDVRDRVRLIQSVLFNKKISKNININDDNDNDDNNDNKIKKKNNNNNTLLQENIKKIFCSKKMKFFKKMKLKSSFKDRSSITLGTLSHFIGEKVDSHIDLPDFPEEQPDPSVRQNKNIQDPNKNEIGEEEEEEENKNQANIWTGEVNEEEFYSDEDEEDENDEDLKGELEWDSEEGEGEGDDDDDENDDENEGDDEEFEDDDEEDEEDDEEEEETDEEDDDDLEEDSEDEGDDDLEEDDEEEEEEEENEDDEESELKKINKLRKKQNEEEEEDYDESDDEEEEEESEEEEEDEEEEEEEEDEEEEGEVKKESKESEYSELSNINEKTEETKTEEIIDDEVKNTEETKTENTEENNNINIENDTNKTEFENEIKNQEKIIEDKIEEKIKEGSIEEKVKEAEEELKKEEEEKEEVVQEESKIEE